MNFENPKWELHGAENHVTQQTLLLVKKKARACLA